VQLVEATGPAAPADPSVVVGGGSPLTPSVSLVQVSGGDSSQSCTFGADEPAGDEDLGAGRQFAGYNTDNNVTTTAYSYYNWSSAPTSWNASSLHFAPSAGYLVLGDSSATHSPTTQLNYLSKLMEFGVSQVYCIGLAATSQSGLESNNWSTYPMNCLPDSASSSTDGTSIHYDEGFHNFWLANSSPSPIPRAANTATLYLFAPCTSGVPCLSGVGCSCPLVGNPYTITPPTGYYIRSQPRIDINPKNGNALVAYRVNNFADTTTIIYLDVFSATTGARLTHAAVATDGFAFNQGQDCTADHPYARCTNGTCIEPNTPPPLNPSNCLRSDLTVHVVGKKDVNSANYYAYLAHDSSCSNGTTKATLRILNINNDLAPTIVRTQSSSSCSASDNEFQAFATASQYNNSVGLFFYRQFRGDPCTTYLASFLDANLGTSIMTYQLIQGTSFPSLVDFSTHGMGDYNSAIKHGVHSGSSNYLFPMWGQPIPYTVSGHTCIPCMGQQFAMDVKGATVVP
jgi:hypothetical protein